jgi:predicted ferric reductase
MAIVDIADDARAHGRVGTPMADLPERGIPTVIESKGSAGTVQPPMSRIAALRSVPVPRTWPLRPSDLGAIAVGNGILIIGMWVRHGGLASLGSLGTQLTAAGQLTALLGTYFVLIQLVLMSRSPWLDQLFGLPRLAVWHRWAGFACLWLLVGHGVLTTVGYAMIDRISPLGEAWSMLTTYPFVLMATVALGLLVLVGISSVQIARGRLSYETWYYLHLYAYIGVALAFAHQLVVGTDFINDPLARAYWIALYGVATASILLFRVGPPIQLALRHRLRVVNIVPEAPGVVSIYVTGRNLDRLPVRAGQFFLWRFLAGDGWWRAHPFSISAAPNGEWLRLTVKGRGDDTRAIQDLRIGTPVLIEGPYGAFTTALASRPRVLLIAGGIGITPLRAMLDEMASPPGALTLIYRASRWEDVIFREELDTLIKQRLWKVHYIIGRRSRGQVPRQPLAATHLRALVPDVARRDVYVCGPDSMMVDVRNNLLKLGVPAEHVHSERFAFA